MQDLTTGSVSGHLLRTTSFMLVTMVFQTLYFLVDLYWVGHLGKEAVAAVGISGNLMFIVLAVTQMLAVGTTTLVSHAAGRKDHDRALLVFNQSQVLSMLAGAVFLVLVMALRPIYARGLSADARTAALASDYLLWFIPASALQFGMVAMGAALATFVAVAVGTVWLLLYFQPKDAYLKFMVADWKPRLDLWATMLKIGMPAGAEFALMAVYLVVVYTIIRPFGSAAQAGFGIGLRIIQAMFMPVVALGFAVAPVAGQNFGARQPHRVRDTFKSAVVLAAVGMGVLALLCHIAPAALIRVFSRDPQVVAVGDEYLRIVSWNFVASGIVFVGSSMFQAIGNTVPSLMSSFVRIVVVAMPAFLLSRLPGFELRWIWYLSVVAVTLQMLMSLLLLQRELKLRLEFEPVPAG